MWNLKYGTNENSLVPYDSQTENRYVVAKEEGRRKRDGLRVWG